MIRNYLLIALRNFRKYKAFTLINLLGLSIALACTMLIYLFVAHEFSYDDFHTHKDRIYLIVSYEQHLDSSAVDYTIAQPYPLGPALLEDMPEVERFVRITYGRKRFVQKDDEVFEEEIAYADSSLFTVFSLPMRYGNADYALTKPNAIAISEKAAKKYFGEANPLGQTLSIRIGSEFEDYEVTVVFEDIPSNSILRSDFFLPMMKETLGKSASYINDPDQDAWGVSAYMTYLLLQENASASALEDKLLVLRNKYYPTEADYLTKREEEFGEKIKRNFHLQKLTGIHLDAEIISSTSSKPIYSYILSGIAGCILLLASINFTLLAISRSNSRAKEVGIRKVVGARRSQLIVQFWGEAILTSILALLLAFLISGLALPMFNEMSQKDLSFATLFQPLSFTVLLGLTLFTGIIAGAYPSLLLAGLNTLSVFKNKISTRKSGALPQVLMATQFVLPVIFLTITTVMIEQLNYMRHKDLGFQTAQILVINNNTTAQAQTFVRFSQLANQQKEVRQITATDAAFTKSGIAYYMRKSEEEQLQFVWAYHVKPNFFNMLDIQIVQGRAFDENIASDSTDAMIVNGAFVKALDLADPIGEEVEGSTIIGIVEDFHFQSLEGEIEPVAFYLPKQRHTLDYMLVQLQSNNLPESVSALSGIWKEIAPDLPFQYSFMDEDMQALYEDDARWTSILQWISGLSVFIACMGLIGVMGLTVAKRTKEIGIRKVLGASVSSLLLLLSRDYIKLILIAFGVAIPIANYCITEWLQNFAYRIEVQWWLFAIPGIVILLIAAISVSSQTFKAAKRNPVDSLRYE
ncbi:ABC transporter permease [Catalinimonas niigatensis]|uniref:ABC transporter permease n=1 Tax=Catalinimonas niigatensis TaxID=1397264 RepID=UPI0026665520|nr:ABC transporter permease [Catalinimonas niigatensis]WPP50208.1 ABC transporter permease [Catalinimonas niigatensis]